MTKYSINRLAKLAGVTTRTLRHYDRLGLLSPSSKTDSGYRLYGEPEVNLLQQILIHKSHGFNLKTIKQIISDPAFDYIHALQNQLKFVQSEQQRLTDLHQTITNTIKNLQGKHTMTDDQKFLGLKKKLIRENDRKYASEVKARWGKEAWQKSNDAFLKIDSRTYEESQRLDTEFHQVLKKAFDLGDPLSDLARQAINLHKQWLQLFWPDYSLDAHLNLAQMYVADQRFHHYFNDSRQMAEFFLDSLKQWAAK